MFFVRTREAEYCPAWFASFPRYVPGPWSCQAGLECRARKRPWEEGNGGGVRCNGGMFTPAAALSLDPPQKHTLESLARAGGTPQGLARKCEVILLAAEGIPNNAIAQKTGLSRPTVIAR
jgi:hypothetical protein